MASEENRSRTRNCSAIIAIRSLRLLLGTCWVLLLSEWCQLQMQVLLLQVFSTGIIEEGSAATTWRLQQQQWTRQAAGTDSDDLQTRATSGARRLHVDKGEEQEAASRHGLSGSRSTKFDTNGTNAQLEVPPEYPLDRPAKRIKHVSKDGKVVGAATGPWVILSNIRQY